MKRGTLFLVPNLLGAVPPARVLPAHTIDVARGLSHWVVENAKPARAFLRTLDLPRPIAECSIRELPDVADGAALATLLAPAREGHDVGLVSDAGCPGVADPGATIVAAAHDAGLRVVPLVGPSALLLALMAAGLNGQRFAFHGYLPADEPGRVAALKRLEAESRAQRCTQLFIETPYRNAAMLSSCVAALAPTTRLCVACDLTLPTESVLSKPVRAWGGSDAAGYQKRPAIFLLLA
jgi:16S rRNA (cytidine1402-2'-O)-methyltransferase